VELMSVVFALMNALFRSTVNQLIEFLPDENVNPLLRSKTDNAFRPELPHEWEDRWEALELVAFISLLQTQQHLSLKVEKQL
jgi:hypothetical protein